MINYFFLKIKEIERHNPDTVTIHFWHPFNEIIAYKPGQFLTVFIPSGDKKVRRSYSLSSSSFTDISPAITVKRIHDGIASAYLIDQVKVGDVLEVMEPMGQFCIEPHEDVTRHMVMIGAGSGITPLISMIKSVLIVEGESTVHLLYGNRNQAQVLFEDQLNKLAQKYPDRFSIQQILSQPEDGWQGDNGRINKAYALKYLSALPENILQSADYYLCGPAGMMEETMDALQVLGVSQEKTHKESFLNPGLLDSILSKNEANAPKTRTIKLRYEREEYDLEVAPHQTVLEAALELDIDLPYSCQAGMCTACLGKCLSGKVKMDEDESLTKAEIEAGYILTCVSHPLTDDVIIEVE